MELYYNTYGSGYSMSSEKGKVNMYCFYRWMKEHGWSFPAICGILGNASAESGLNPNRAQNGYSEKFPTTRVARYAFGFLQYDPWYNAIDRRTGKPADPANYHGTGNPTLGYWAEHNGYTIDRSGSPTSIGSFECQLEYLNNNLGSGAGKSWVRNFRTYSGSPEDAAREWYFNYERSGVWEAGDRPDRARTAYNYLVQFEGSTPPPAPDPDPSPDPEPTPDPVVKKKSNIILLMKGAKLL